MGTYPRVIKTYTQIKFSTKMLIAALFPTVPNWKE
jgi:hypothetical protein